MCFDPLHVLPDERQHKRTRNDLEETISWASLYFSSSLLALFRKTLDPSFIDFSSQDLETPLYPLLPLSTINLNSAPFSFDRLSSRAVEAYDPTSSGIGFESAFVPMSPLASNALDASMFQLLPFSQ